MLIINFFNAFTNSIPFIPAGICQSTKIISKGDSCLSASIIACKPFSADSDATTLSDIAINISSMINLADSLSSITRTDLLLKSSLNKTLFVMVLSSLNLAVNQNVLPLPNSLSTPTSPPIRLANCFDMASPKPVPPNLREVEVSAC